MSERSTEQIRELLDSIYRLESRRILATLIRLLGGFDLAEEAMHEAFAAALSLWPTSGVPVNPRPWLDLDGPIQSRLILCVAGQDLMPLKTSSCDISKRNAALRKGPMKRRALRMALKMTA